MPLVRCERSGRTNPPKKRPKSAIPKQSIALFFHCSTMTVAPPCLLLNFRTKEKMLYSVESDDFFQRSLYFWDENGDFLY